MTSLIRLSNCLLDTAMRLLLDHPFSDWNLHPEICNDTDSAQQSFGAP
jgi:hypothetical protein